jgi:hypothetical protein
MFRVFTERERVRGFLGKRERESAAYTKVREEFERAFNNKSAHPLPVMGEL